MLRFIFMFFFFNDTATTEIYTLSLHDALPIWEGLLVDRLLVEHRLLGGELLGRGLDDLELLGGGLVDDLGLLGDGPGHRRSEEHTSELQSRQYLVCRLLLEKKKKKTYTILMLQ